MSYSENGLSIVPKVVRQENRTASIELGHLVASREGEGKKNPDQLHTKEKDPLRKADESPIVYVHFHRQRAQKTNTEQTNQTQHARRSELRGDRRKEYLVRERP
jgi:hypothetical protein